MCISTVAVPVASLGAFFYLVMDMIIQWRVFRYARRERGAAGPVLLATLAFGAVVLAAFTSTKLQSDPLIVIIAAVAIAAVFGFERIYIGRWTEMRGNGHAVHKGGGPHSMCSDRCKTTGSSWLSHPAL